MKEPALDFWRQIPTVWDDTKALQGKIGEYAVIARRSGNQWFLGALNANQVRTFDVPLNFLGEGKYVAHLYRDAATDGTRPKDVVCETKNVSSVDHLQVKAASNGGFSVRFEKVK